MIVRPKTPKGCIYASPIFPQLINSMPSLNVPCVSLSISSALTPSNLLNSTIGGIVASPTPTVPISSDSIKVTVQFSVPITRPRAAAVIQPEVPPPTTTKFLILLVFIEILNTLRAYRSKVHSH